MDDRIECDVVIVGLGPTGATLANLLGQYGWSVVGLERSQEVYHAPRAVHFDDEAMRVFQAIGLSESIAEDSEPFREMEFALSPGTKAILRLPVGSQDDRYGHAGAWWFHQPTLERRLRDGLGRFSNVTPCYGVEVIGIEQDSETVTAQYVDRHGVHHSVRARYLIGCDGGRSFVRSQANLALKSACFDQPWVVVDAEARCGCKEPTLPPVHRQICNPSQPTTYVPGTKSHYRWEFMVVDGKPAHEATSTEHVRKLLAEFVDLEKIDVVRTAYYNFHAVWASRWRSGRILLAGDAAHQMPPFLGQGMCSGVRDAHAVGWRLDVVLSGLADERLFDSYEQERSRHVLDIIKGAVMLGRIMHTQSRMIAFLRNWLLFRTFAVLPPLRRWFYLMSNRKRPLSSGFIGTNCPQLAGRLAIQPLVRVDDDVVRLDDMLGSRFALLSRAGCLDRASEIVQRLGQSVLIKHVEFDNRAAGAVIEDHQKLLAGWFDRHRVDFVLIRPDRYVFDAGKCEALGDVVSNFQEQLRRRHTTEARANESLYHGPICGDDTESAGRIGWTMGI